MSDTAREREGGWQLGLSDSDKWIQTYTGRQFFPLDPDPGDVSMTDISHALAMKCRFTGHSNMFYSVAEHSTLMARYALRHLSGYEPALWALLHDAGEAYLPDVCRPLKPALEGFGDVELGVQRAVMEGLGYDWPGHDVVALVKDLDKRILLTEMKNLMPSIEGRAYGNVEGDPLDVPIWGWSPEQAKHEFVDTYTNIRRRISEENHEQG